MTGKQHRKLAAILFADLVGYTKLMQTNEENASATLKVFQSTIKEKVLEHKGQIVNFYGDGALTIFDTPAQAMQCAMELQRAWLPQHVSVRIGVHSGTVIFDDDQVYGDSVNLTSRIESMGVGGSVLFSERVRKDIKNHPKFESVSLGSFDFKNVEEPVEVYALTNDGFPLPQDEDIIGKLKGHLKSNKRKDRKWLLPGLVVGAIVLGLFWWTIQTISAGDAGSSQAEKVNILPDAPSKSIAVLPFRNMSNDSEQQYFSDGISEEILNALSQLKDLKISGRSSSFQFREEQVDLKEVGEKLGVTTVLEGSVRKMGNRVRIIAQLTNIEDGFQIWSDRYDRELEDVFAIQDEIAQAIVKNLELAFSSNENAHIVKMPTENQEAYDLFLKGLHLGNLGQFKNSVEYLEKATQLDSDFALAYAYLSIYTFFIYQPIGKIVSPEIEAMIRAYAEKAMNLDSTLAMAYSAMAYIYHDFDNDYFRAQKSLEKGLEYNPSSADLYKHLAHNTFFQSGDPEKGIRYAKKAVELDPLNSENFLHLSAMYLYARKDEDAKALTSEIDSLFPGDPLGQISIGQLKGYLKDYQGAYEFIHPTRAILEDNKFTFFYAHYIASVARSGKKEEASNLLEEFKTNPEWEASPFSFAIVNLALGDKEQVYQNLEQSFEINDFTALRDLKINPFWDELRGEPRFEGLLERLELRN